MNKTVLLIVSCLMVIALNAQSIKKISLQEAFELAAQNSNLLQTDSLKIHALEFKKKQTQNAMLPVVALNSSYARLSNNIDPFSISIPGLGDKILNPQILNQFINRVSLQQPVFQGLRNWNTMKAIDQQKLAGSFDLQKDEQDIRMNVIQMYYGLYKLQQTISVLDTSIGQTQVRIDDIRKFKNAGLALNNDVMRAELQKTNLEVNKADAQSMLEIYNFNMCIALGLDVSTKIEVQNPDIVNEADATIQSLLTSSYTDRTEFKAQNYRSKAAEYQIKASKAAYMPTVSAVGNGYYNNPNQRVFPQENKFKATWDVGVSISWNILQLYTARSVVSDAKNQKAQLELVTAQLKDNISAEVNAAYQNLKVSLLKIDLAQRAIEQATENKRIFDNQFNAQIAVLSDVLEADQLLLQAKTNLLNAQADAAIANYKLQRSLGSIK